jgi:putative Holliday junction resolvase
MRYLGIDYGKRRVGLSYADEIGIAVPICPIVNKTGEKFWLALSAVVIGRKIEAFVVGHPVGMDDVSTPWTRRVEDFIGELSHRYKLPVHVSDERLTSFQVDADLASLGLRVRRERIQNHRATGKDDSSAAALILQDFLDVGDPPAEQD